MSVRHHSKRTQTLAMSVDAYGKPTGVQIPPATDFRTSQTASSRYRYRRIVPDGNQSCVVVPAASNARVTWRFGAGYVLNLSKSRIRLMEQISNGGVLTIYKESLPPIASVRLETSSGVLLCEIKEFNAFQKVVNSTIFNAMSTKFDESKRVVFTEDPSNGNQTNSAAGTTATAIAYPSAIKAQRMQQFRQALYQTTNYSGTAIGSNWRGLTVTTPATARAYDAAMDYPFVSQFPHPGTGNSLGVTPTVYPSCGCTVNYRQNTTVYPVRWSQSTYRTGMPVHHPASSSDSWYWTNVLPVTGVGGGRALNTRPILFQSIAGAMAACIGASGTPYLEPAVANIFWECTLADIFPHTLFSESKDLYFGTDLILTVDIQGYQSRSWSAYENGLTLRAVSGSGTAAVTPSVLGYTTTNTYWPSLSGTPQVVSYGQNAQYQVNATPMLGCTATTISQTLDNGTPTTLSGTWYCFQDLILAIQDNLDLVNTVKQEIAERGIRIPVQMPIVRIDQLPALSADYTSTSALVNLNLTISSGASLLRVYSALMTSRTNSSANVAPIQRLIDNAGCCTWSTRRTYLNGVPTSDTAESMKDNYDKSLAENDFCVSSKIFNSAPGLTAMQEFSQGDFFTPVVIDDYTSRYPLLENTPLGGLPLANPLIFSTEWNYGQGIVSACTIESAIVAIVQKYLSISKVGVTLESV